MSYLSYDRRVREFVIPLDNGDWAFNDLACVVDAVRTIVADEALDVRAIEAEYRENEHTAGGKLAITIKTQVNGPKR